MSRERAATRCGFALSLSALAVCAAHATPEEFDAFKRDQKIQHAVTAGAILRIWVAYIGQGDAIFIEFPRGAAASFDGRGRLQGGAAEPIELLIDSGASPRSEADRLLVFLDDLRPQGFTLEHVVISHHDEDHVEGIIRLLERPAKKPNAPKIAVGTIHHTGLASFAGGKRGFPLTGKPANTVSEGTAAKFKRGMAFLKPDGSGLMIPDHFIKSFDELKLSHAREEFQGVYLRLATAVVGAHAASRLAGFDRAFFGRPAIDIPVPDAAAMAAPDQVHLEFLWPREQPRRYGQWSTTINGNSVVLRLTYGEFSILLTGDLNAESERDLIQLLTEKQRLDVLDNDVLKVPHHGSQDGERKFFATENNNQWTPRPVLGVASMGKHGFAPKFQHPREVIADWFGGAQRVYYTHVHEKRLNWSQILASETVKKSFLEGSHILIETDGVWFRVAEIHDTVKPIAVPDVTGVRPGDGTRWIRAVPEN